HVKLYSICFTVLGGVLGENVVTVEPLNLVYYLTILVLVFMLAREIFDETLGLVAAALVAVWPSLLLQTTQLLRDQLFIIGMLSFMNVCARFLVRSYSWRG